MIKSQQFWNELADFVVKLRNLSKHSSESELVATFSGEEVTKDVYCLLSSIQNCCTRFSLPRIQIGDDQVNLGENGAETDYDEASGQPWSIQIGKSDLLKNSILPSEETSYYFFFFPDLFFEWSLRLDLLRQKGALYNPFNTKIKTIIYVKDIESFGSEMLSVLPWFGEREEYNKKYYLPENETVQELLHIVSQNMLQISPLFFGLTWGNLSQEYAYGMLVNSIRTLACCLVHELKENQYEYFVVLKGLKKISPILKSKDEKLDYELNEILLKVVSWVFEERIETRHQLISDKLSIDCGDHDSFCLCLKNKLEFAWEQAKDSYGFVILDRKDAHQKELRDFMKDMRAQADLYAAKVRDLLSGLSRDFLAILLLIGLTLIKIDFKESERLLKEPAGILFVYILSGYLLVSALLQAYISWKDVTLTYDESSSWTEILRNYTHSSDIQEKYEAPIKKRKHIFYWMLFIFISLYISFSLTIYNLSNLVNWINNYNAIQVNKNIENKKNEGLDTNQYLTTRINNPKNEQ